MGKARQLRLFFSLSSPFQGSSHFSVCLPVSEHVHAGALRGQKRAAAALELQFRVIVRCC